MSRTPALFLISLAFAITVVAQDEPTTDASDYIRIDRMNTYDTGLRLNNGQWSIGSAVSMSYFNRFGRLVETDWRAFHFISNRTTGDYIVNNNATFRSYEFVSQITGVADFAACYQGRAVATAGGAAAEVGGNHVCTDPAPPSTGSGGGNCTGELCTGGQQTSGCEYTAEGCPWWYQCPLIVNLEPGPWRLSSTDDPVRFDMDADGIEERLAWPIGAAPLAFLALDIDADGSIANGSELFGVGTMMPDGTRAKHGFAALAAHDANGDGWIDASDPVWSRLTLWRDANRDGASQPSELVTPAAAGVTSLGLAHHWTGRRDDSGNAFRYQAAMTRSGQAAPYYDVFLRALP